MDTFNIITLIVSVVVFFGISFWLGKNYGRNTTWKEIENKINK